MMRKLGEIYSFALLTVMATMTIACNDREDENLIMETNRIKIDSVSIPQDSMNVFDIQTITTFSDYKMQCEGFYGYDYDYTAEFERSVSAYNFKTNAACNSIVARASKINFRPQKPGNYLFRFFNGKNTAGESQWIEKTITAK